MSRASVVHSWRPADEDGVVASVCGLILGRFKPAPEGSLPCKICSRILTGKSWLDTSAMPEEGPADARAAPPRPDADFAAWLRSYNSPTRQPRHRRDPSAIDGYDSADMQAAWTAATARIRAMVEAEVGDRRARILACNDPDHHNAEGAWQGNIAVNVLRDLLAAIDGGR